MADMKFVSTNASIPFRCQKCGKCCKNLKDSLMLESIDIFYLTKSLRRHDSSITCTDDMLERYAHVAAIERGFPIYQANTVGVDAACVFLENDRCRVYDARPLVCRMFPFGIAPGEKGRDFRFYLVMDQSHHFGAGQVIVKDWVNDNFSREAKEYYREETALISDIGPKLARLSATEYNRIAFPLLNALYSDYDLDAPFLVQYRRNCDTIRRLFDRSLNE